MKKLMNTKILFLITQTFLMKSYFIFKLYLEEEFIGKKLIDLTAE